MALSSLQSANSQVFRKFFPVEANELEEIRVRGDRLHSINNPFSATLLLNGQEEQQLQVRVKKGRKVAFITMPEVSSGDLNAQIKLVGGNRKPNNAQIFNIVIRDLDSGNPDPTNGGEPIDATQSAINDLRNNFTALSSKVNNIEAATLGAPVNLDLDFNKVTLVDLTEIIDFNNATLDLSSYPLASEINLFVTVDSNMSTNFNGYLTSPLKIVGAARGQKVNIIVTPESKASFAINASDLQNIRGVSSLSLNAYDSVSFMNIGTENNYWVRLNTNNI
jgi:hypothetical protein